VSVCVWGGGGGDFCGRTLFNGFMICNFRLMKRTCNDYFKYLKYFENIKKGTSPPLGKGNALPCTPSPASLFSVCNDISRAVNSDGHLVLGQLKV
jgi:hypothetical protein